MVWKPKQTSWPTQYFLTMTFKHNMIWPPTISLIWIFYFPLFHSFHSNNTGLLAVLPTHWTHVQSLDFKFSVPYVHSALHSDPQRSLFNFLQVLVSMSLFQWELACASQDIHIHINIQHTWHSRSLPPCLRYITFFLFLQFITSLLVPK